MEKQKTIRILREKLQQKLYPTLPDNGTKIDYLSNDNELTKLKRHLQITNNPFQTFRVSPNDPNLDVHMIKRLQLRNSMLLMSHQPLFQQKTNLLQCWHRSISSAVQVTQLKNRLTKLKVIDIFRRLSKALIYMCDHHITVENLFRKEVFSSVPFEKTHSRQFLKACKNQDTTKVQFLLSNNRFLTFDYDYCYQTGLHWACRRNNLEIVKLIVESGGDINCHNIIGQTPLFFSLMHSDCRILSFLLHRKADPWSQKYMNYNKAALKNPLAGKLLRCARKLHIKLKFVEYSRRQVVWDKERDQILNLCRFDFSALQQPRAPL